MTNVCVICMLSCHPCNALFLFHRSRLSSGVSLFQQEDFCYELLLWYCPLATNSLRLIYPGKIFILSYLKEYLPGSRVTGYLPRLQGFIDFSHCFGFHVSHKMSVVSVIFGTGVGCFPPTLAALGVSVS